MSGDSQRSEDPDFLDDDFVIEDIAGKNDDLDQLFTAPGVPAATPKNPAAAPSDAGGADADDLLFTDHTQGLQPTEKFVGGRAFGEGERSAWSGENLELDEVGVPETDAVASVESTLVEAEARFANELGSMLRGEEDFALDSESELELVDGVTPADGVSEIEQSGPFVLDDGEGAWQEDAATTAEGEAPAVVAEGELVEEGVAALDGENLPTLAAEETPIEEGWEPLPGTSVDQLSEVGEVARVDETPVEAGSSAPIDDEGSGAEAAAAAEGHDLYATESAAPVLIGPRVGRRRIGGMVRFLVAATLLLGAAGTAVLRPEWLGLSVEPERVQQVQIERPRVEVAMTAPTAPPTLVKGEPNSTPAVTPPEATKPEPKEPVTSEVGKPTTSPLVQGDEPGPTKPGTAPTPESTPPVAPPVASTEPPAAEPAPPLASVPVAVPAPLPAPAVTEPATSSPVAAQPTEPQRPTTSPETAWPVVAAPSPEPAVKTAQPRLVRVSDDLMLGDVGEQKRPVNVVEGVLPGSRAFAQLHNGNYFIGSIKCADAQSITLRVGDGEVTLATVEVASLTELGSTDYEDLQKATSGFVRLTNNNRLVGGILSRIADDHIVLEFRSNRVMLPRSAVGEVVQGEGDAAVRLDVTREEDNWVKQLAERQLGTGAGPALVPPKAAGPKSPVAPSSPAPTPPSTAAPNAPAAPAPGRHR